MRDDAPDVEPLIQPLTRPPTYFGVDIIVFVVNGIFGIVIFIASSSFLAPLVVLNGGTGAQDTRIRGKN